MGPLPEYPGILPNQLRVNSVLPACGLREGLEHMGSARTREEGSHLCSHHGIIHAGSDFSTWLLEGHPYTCSQPLTYTL